MEQHMKAVRVKPRLCSSLLAKVAGECTGAAREMLISDGHRDTDDEVADAAVEMARLIVLRAIKVADMHNESRESEIDRRCLSGHYRVGPQGIVPVGMGSNEEETIDEDMDPINGG
jgi:hypothetical protein